MVDYYNSDVFLTGYYRALIHKKNATGYAMGQFTDAVIEDTTPANTEVSEALTMNTNVVSLGNPGQARIKISRFGAQKFRGKFDVGAGEIADFQMTFSDDSPSLAFVTNGALINDTEIVGVIIGGENPRPELLNDVGGIFTVGAQVIDRTTGNVTTEYLHYWIPSFTAAKVNSDVAGVQSSTTNPFPSAYDVSVQETGLLQNGRLISALDIGMTQSYRVPFRTPYKNHGLATAIFDGTDTSFTLPRLPLLNATAATSLNWFTLNGTPTALSSVNTSTGVVTLSSAPTAGAIGVMWYPLADQS